MAVVLYWNQRLAERNPLRDPELRIEGVNIKSREVEDSWPRAVAKQAQYMDYLKWFDEEYLPSFASVDYYRDFPDQLPKPANELEFFTTIAPFMYVVGRKQQVRSYAVKQQQTYEGEWMTIKKTRNFTRLCEWEEHVAAFVVQTGIEIKAPPPRPKKQDVELVAGATKIVVRKIAQNKATIDRQMGKD